MRFVRRASLLLSVALMVAIAVGFFTRSNELDAARDQRLRNAAEVASNELASVVRTLRVGVAVGDDAAGLARVVAEQHPELGLCVVGRDGSECAGAGRRPDADTVAGLSTAPDDAIGDDVTGDAATSDDVPGDAATSDDAISGLPRVTVYDGLLTIVVRGPELAVVARREADLRDRDGVSVFASALRPADESVGGFVSDRDFRQTAMAVAGSPGLYAVASSAGDSAAALPVDEQRFYLIVFSLAVVLMLLASVTLVVEHRTLIERARVDALTRLPNRGEFERRTAAALAESSRLGEGLCLMVFDLDGFKQINDTYGHTFGDEILRIVANRLERAVRADRDIVARWGGDEFAVVVPGTDSLDACLERAHRLSDEVGGRTRVDGAAESVRVKATVGVAASPHHGDDLDTLFEAADQAMYEAKREGVAARLATAPGASRFAVG